MSDWPSLRLVIPLAGGILLSDTIQDTDLITDFVMYLSVPLITVVLLSFWYGPRVPRLYGTGLMLSFFMLGAWSYSGFMEKVHVEWPQQECDYWGHVTDWPQEKARSYRIDLRLDCPDYAGRDIILYVPKDSSVNRLEPGVTLAFHGRVEKPQNGDSVTFDYASYLYRHGISGSLWVPSVKWKPVTSLRCRGVRLAASRLRRTMMLKLREWGLDGNAFAVVAAVSLGEKRALDDSLRQVYSSSGASHLLAVSGLHVGIMFWLLGLLVPKKLFPFRLSWIRDVIVMALMWTYAVAIGMPLSIVRAMIMFSMLSFCRAVGRDSQPVNTLSFAALAILAVQPQGLFDMGFQLSFSAVLAILLFESDIRGLLAPRTAVGKYLWGTVSVSLAAQLGTAPLVAYHFGTFSTYFLLTNMLAIPVMFPIVCLSMMLWAVGWFPAVSSVIVKVLVFLVKTENGFLTRIVSLPHPVIGLETDSAGLVWIVYFMMLALWLWIRECRSSRLVQGLWLVVLVQVMQLFQNFVV